MLAAVASAALLGVDAHRVDIEIDLVRRGMPSFSMVGLAEGAVREAKDRVFASLRNTGHMLPPSRITVNLAPAALRKDGSGYDFPLALGLLAAAGVISTQALDGLFVLGELSLAGEIKPIAGALPLALLARAAGARGVLVPQANAAEAAVVEGLAVWGMEGLSEAVAFVAGQCEKPPEPCVTPTLWKRADRWPVDFVEVKGQEHAKRAMEIAAAGAHNLLMIGPPGSGKTMLAQRLPTVLPPLSFEEALEVTKIYSVAGQLDAGGALMTRRPFRSPHHTITHPGLVGGGSHPRPGEVSMAHRGVLFLDELPEFKKNVLEGMRQPLEDGGVTLSRAAMSLSYPADFMLVAAMNPCPCGYLSDERRVCHCTAAQIQRYRSRLSGPLLDRIDLHVEVPAVPYEDLRGKEGESSSGMRERILRARELQYQRYADSSCLTNADLVGKELEEYCRLGKAEHEFLEEAVHTLALSARAYTRILRIARTIADLAGQATISRASLAEAINCRTLDRQSL